MGQVYLSVCKTARDYSRRKSDKKIISLPTDRKLAGR